MCSYCWTFVWSQKLQIWITFRLRKRSDTLFHFRLHPLTYVSKCSSQNKTKASSTAARLSVSTCFGIQVFILHYLHIIIFNDLQRFLVLVTSTFGLTLCCNNFFLINGLLNLSHGKLISRDYLLSHYLFYNLLSHSSWLVWKYCRTPTH